MSIEVFVFGANNGAFSFPDKDASYFETTFYTDIKELPKNTPLFDVRLRQVREQRWVDYTVLVYGLKGSRDNDYVGITCRSAMLFKDLNQIYAIMNSCFASCIIGTLVKKDLKELVGGASLARDIPLRIEKKIGEFITSMSITAEEDFIRIPNNTRESNGKLHRLSTIDLPQCVDYSNVLYGGGRLLFSDSFPSKRENANLKEYEEQVRQINSKHKSNLDELNRNYQSSLEEERERSREVAEENLDLKEKLGAIQEIVSGEKRLENQNRLSNSRTIRTSGNNNFDDKNQVSQTLGKSSKVKRGGEETSSKGGTFCLFKQNCVRFIPWIIVALLLGAFIVLYFNGNVVFGKKRQEIERVDRVINQQDSVAVSKETNQLK